MPLASVVLDISLGGEPLAVNGRPMPLGFVAGLTETVCSQAVGASQEGIQIFLTPSGAASVCGVSSAELAGQAIRFDALGMAQREIASRLREEKSWQRRFALLDTWLQQRLATRRVQRLVELTVAALRDDTRPRLQRIACDAGYSTRHLSRVFATEVGVPPKTYARLARFGRFVSHLRKRVAPAPGETWASLAGELGFSDQAHFIREVRHFSGTTPAALAHRLEVFAPAPSPSDAR